MQKPPSEALSALRGSGHAVARLLSQRGAHPLVLGALALALLLLAIATDVAARAGSIPFVLLCYAHVRRARKVTP